ncbi:MAG TPA: SIR2 family protein, partial [Aggregicoccus sp.]|nr:SIR2 family protein [Aggregicoccus sp.]
MSPAPSRRSVRSARTALLEAGRKGGLTLVLGAGVSFEQRVPGWPALVRSLWEDTFPRRALPAVDALPNLLPLALELVARERGEEDFARALHARLYRDVQVPTREALLQGGGGTLGALARALVREHARGARRRVVRVVSFNADDLLAEACRALAPPGSPPLLKPLVRASHHPERGLGEQPLPLYHLHGYLPRRTRRAGDAGGARWHEEAPDALVFTDAQYWASVAEPMSFANRVMSFVLHDSRCVFVGLSMTDLNLLRWLALRAQEVEADKAAQFSRDTASPERVLRAQRQALCRH